MFVNREKKNASHEKQILGERVIRMHQFILWISLVVLLEVNESVHPIQYVLYFFPHSFPCAMF